MGFGRFGFPLEVSGFLTTNRNPGSACGVYGSRLGVPFLNNCGVIYSNNTTIIGLIAISGCLLWKCHVHCWSY